MNRKTVVIHQPDFMPYLGFFHRFLHADMYIALDHVQFVHSNRGWTHRDKIKTPQGAKWLTVSVKKAPRNTAINRIELADTGWRQDNLSLLEQNYRKTPGYQEVMPEIECLYAQPFQRLSDFNMSSVELLMDLLDARIPWIWSSSLDPQGAKNELLVDLLLKAGATHYLSGNGARDYFQPEPFARAGIEVVWQDFTHPVYTQQFDGFLPYLSSLDLLFNQGIMASREILRRQG
ncbi:MAG: WbqC family protein [Pseudomonadota bacterium]